MIKIGMEVDVGPGDIVLDGDPPPPNQSINQSFAMAPPSDVQGRLTIKWANEKYSE